MLLGLNNKLILKRSQKNKKNKIPSRAIIYGNSVTFAKHSRFHVSQLLAVLGAPRGGVGKMPA